MLGNILKTIGYALALIVAAFMAITFPVWIVGFVILIAGYFLVMHILGARITIKKEGVLIGYYKRFKYYPIRY